MGDRYKCKIIMIKIKQKEFQEIVSYVREHYGINLEKKKILIECRLAKELDKYNLSSFGAYLHFMKTDKTGKIAGEMINRLTTNYTYFMREAEHFDFLEKDILPQLLANKSHASYRIWCAGCSSGEECYTLAMKFRDFQEQHGKLPVVSILATDIAEEVLGQARSGIYSIREWDSLPKRWQQMYCRKLDDKRFEVEPSLRKYIQFKNQNLLQANRVEEKFDLILCRNVMIYFDKESKMKLIKRFENCLKPGGYLFIGHAELIPRDETALEYVCSAVYRKK